MTKGALQVEIERWDITKEIAIIHEEVDRIFNNFFGKMAPDIMKTDYFTPQANIYENKDVLMIEIALPGVNKEDIDLSLQQDKLIVSGMRIGVSDVNFHQQELPYGNFEREVILPFPTTGEDIHA